LRAHGTSNRQLTWRTRCSVILDKIIRAVVVLLAGVLLWLLMHAFVSDANAQQCTHATGLEKGNVAPCGGVLFPQFWAIKAIKCVDVDLPLEKTKHAECLELHQAATETWTETRANYERQVLDLEKITREAARIERPWFESKWIWLGIGVLAGGTVVYITK